MKGVNNFMKELICTTAGLLGAATAWAFGGWDTALAALVICMTVDYISGSTVALVFHKSRKTESGAYNSTYGLKGLCKKGLMLLFVVVAVQADRLLGADYVRDAVCIGFCVNEILSIVENLGLAGVPLPKAVVKALEQLQSKE
jgi:toxin secretion/phage lysis holin